MREKLNPYQAWLDIPATEQPPDHYTLLGIRRFETDSQVIKRAAEKRIAHIREKSAGSNQEIAEWLVAQIAAALACLTAPGPREAYDRALLRRASATASNAEHRSAKTAARPAETAKVYWAASPIWKRQLTVAVAAAVMVVVVGATLMVYSAGNSGNSANRQSVAAAHHSRPPAHDSRTQEAAPSRARESRDAGGDGDSVESATVAPELPSAINTNNRQGAARDDVRPGVAGSQALGGGADASRSLPSNVTGSAQPSPPLLEKPAIASVEVPAASPAAAIAPATDAHVTPPWLRINENGEPCEATLADGTLLPLDTYEDSFQGYQSLTPVDASQARVVFDYQTARLGPNHAITFLRLDAAGGRMYWIEVGASGHYKIRSVKLDGRDVRVLVDLPNQGVGGLALDHERNKVYWGNHAAKTAAFGRPPDARQAVWRANLDGSDPEPVFGGLPKLAGIAVEPATGRIFYFDGVRLVRGEPDGTGESQILDVRRQVANLPHSGFPGFDATIDAEHAKIYWIGSTYFARANLDGSSFEVPFDIGQSMGHIRAIGLDVPNDQAYLVEEARREVWRTSLDGSHPQTVAIGMKACPAMAVDSLRGHLYFVDQKFVGIDNYPLIRKLKVPLPPTGERMPAPPLIRSIEPRRQSAGGDVTLRGQHFSGVTNVRVIGDDGQQSGATFKVLGDTEISFALPPRRRGVELAAIVVQGLGGLTVTLPRDARSVTAFNGGYDRLHDNKTFCFVVAPNAQFGNAEHSVVYASARAWADAGRGRGNAVLFLKSGATAVITEAPDVVVYHEPFAQIVGRAKGAGECEMVAVPAIRASFVESLLQYTE